MSHCSTFASGSNPLLNAALGYAAAGIAVFPAHYVRADFTCSCGDVQCQHVGKHPDGRLVPHGHLEASADPEQVAAWWRAEPEANIAENPARSGEIVADIDPRHDGDATWAMLVQHHPELEPPTRTVLTPSGGRHLHFSQPLVPSPPGDRTHRFAQPAQTLYFSGSLGPGVELKVDGSIHLPPSNHVAGTYRWKDKAVPLREWPLSPIITTAIQDAADRDAGRSPRIPQTAAERAARTKGRLTNRQAKLRGTTVAPEGAITPGARNATLASIAGTMRNRGLDEDAIRAALLVVNRTKCRPPLCDAEVRDIAASIALHDPKVALSKVIDTLIAKRGGGAAADGPMGSDRPAPGREEARPRQAEACEGPGGAEEAGPQPAGVENAGQAMGGQAGLAPETTPAHDPLIAIGREIRAQGYGGDIRPAMITRIAMTTRLLMMRRGSMPAHLLLLGPSSAGKNWLVTVNTISMPASAHHVIPAGSAKALIHDHAPLQHRLVIFGEADSLPAGEDNPAASAIRNLLTDHHLWYALPVRHPQTGRCETERITRPGPSVLITTSTKTLGDQFMTRVFTVEVPDDRAYLQAALEAQACIELDGLPQSDPTLVAFEDSLQAQAPWRVMVPFAPELARLLGKVPVGARILRDYPRLISMIKAVAVLRHARRKRAGSGEGALLATLDDYAAVYDLAHATYAESATGGGARVRAVVAIVADLRDKADAATDGRTVTIHAVGKALRLSYNAARYRCHAALTSGWIVNLAEIDGRYDLAPAEDTGPQPSGMPTPQALADAIARAHPEGPTAQDLLLGVTPLIPPGSYGDVVTPPANPWEIWPNEVTNSVTKPFGDGAVGEEPEAEPEGGPHNTHQSPKGAGDGFGDAEIHIEQGLAVDVTNSPTGTVTIRPSPGGLSDADILREALLADGRSLRWPLTRLVADAQPVRGEQAWTALIMRLGPEQIAQAFEAIEHLRRQAHTEGDRL